MPEAEAYEPLPKEQFIALGYISFVVGEQCVIASPLPGSAHPVYEFFERREGDVLARFPETGCVYLISDDGAVYGALPESTWA